MQRHKIQFMVVNGERREVHAPFHSEAFCWRSAACLHPWVADAKRAVSVSSARDCQQVFEINEKGTFRDTGSPLTSLMARRVAVLHMEPYTS
jgi:hypothetical protein